MHLFYDKILSEFEQKDLSMDTLTKFAFCSLSICLLSVAVEAQRRTPVVRPKPTVVSTSPTPNSTLQSDAQKVSNQVINVTKFIYLLGGIAKGIEDLDKDTKANRAAMDKNAINKKGVIQTIRNLRAGLATLEIEFRTKPLLRKYLLKIEGISALSGQSEDLALAGRFTESGRPLVAVVEKLSDTLVAMP